MENKTKILDIILCNYFKEGKPQYFFTSSIMEKAKIDFEEANEILRKLDETGFLTVHFDLICPKESDYQVIMDGLDYKTTKEILQSGEFVLCDHCGKEFIPTKEDFLYLYLPNKSYFELYQKERESLHAY